MKLCVLLSSANHAPDDRASIKRLFFIANACPPLAPLALSRAVEYALEGKDSTLYQNVVSTYNNVVGPQRGVRLNQEWLDRTAQRSQAERDKLEVELKMYTGNMIKESIRVRAWPRLECKC